MTDNQDECVSATMWTEFCKEAIFMTEDEARVECSVRGWHYYGKDPLMKGVFFVGLNEDTMKELEELANYQDEQLRANEHGMLVSYGVRIDCSLAP